MSARCKIRKHTETHKHFKKTKKHKYCNFSTQTYTKHATKHQKMQHSMLLYSFQANQMNCHKQTVCNYIFVNFDGNNNAIDTYFLANIYELPMTLIN